MNNKRHKGMHQHRFRDNPEERAFADAWDQAQVGRTLAHILDTTQGRGHLYTPEDPSERDRTVAATVIQWLGSPVGRCFLWDLGYVKRDGGER